MKAIIKIKAEVNEIENKNNDKNKLKAGSKAKWYCHLKKPVSYKFKYILVI